MPNPKVRDKVKIDTSLLQEKRNGCGNSVEVVLEKGTLVKG